MISVVVRNEMYLPELDYVSLLEPRTRSMMRKNY